jgi:hypothetical protein
MIQIRIRTNISGSESTEAKTYGSYGSGSRTLPINSNDLVWWPDYIAIGKMTTFENDTMQVPRMQFLDQLIWIKLGTTK